MYFWYLLWQLENKGASQLVLINYFQTLFITEHIMCVWWTVKLTVSSTPEWTELMFSRFLILNSSSISKPQLHYRQMLLVTEITVVCKKKIKYFCPFHCWEIFTSLWDAELVILSDQGAVFQIKPVLPPKADKNFCGRTDIGPSPPCRMGNFGASLELLGPQKSFTYQNLQNFVREIAGLFSKRSLQNFIRCF